MALTSASPAPSGSTVSEMPSATPFRGYHPPSQYTTGPDRERTRSRVQSTATAAVVPTASASAMRRGRCFPTAARAAAQRSGRATGRASTSALEPRKRVRIDGLRVLVRMHDEGEEQCHHRGLDDDVREHQCLHHWIDGDEIVGHAVV